MTRCIARTRNSSCVACTRAPAAMPGCWPGSPVASAAIGADGGSHPRREAPRPGIRPPQLRRSWLFLPGAEAAVLRAAPALGADVLMQELEDFCPADRR